MGASEKLGAATHAAGATMTTEQYRVWLGAQMLEETLQTHVLALAKTFGWLAYHTYNSRRSQKGFPDLVLVHGGQRRVLFRELKRAKGRVTPEQQVWLDTLQLAGADADVWRPREYFDGTVERTLRGGGDPNVL